jgi:superoxide dismutase, Cu-Zn family
MKKTAAVVAFSLLFAACPDTRQVETTDTQPATPPAIDAPAGDAALAGTPNALAVLINAQGDSVGQATFRETPGGVQIMVSARGLPPGERAIHLHETGQCDPPTFQSAGGHFAPMDRAHGFEHPQGPHAGDLRNITIGADGALRQEFLNERITLREGQPNSILDGDGTALVIHAEPDDYVSQPSGDAGDRIACGVVRSGM